MVGFFSRLGSRKGHRRAQSAIETSDTSPLPRNAEVVEESVVDCAAAAAVHGIEICLEFKPVEHPMEPLEQDHPVQCPQLDTSLLNDGRVFKERLSSVNAKEEGSHSQQEAVVGENI
ncbi:uncharacterized protein LOC120259408 [Dioscorea cayenensis subsp. rotundata]|uniref:Uncharacterized protein LOC120259408 n=1 Tax=Dioscorea cayennensis subsp. rotundata TaxID=55577 RepID=A0AB40B6Q4_DIOCR|nr:uncharacterized protein LOC120259408 [Dioscorea cayenensis subsp. rotundata]